MKGHPIRFLLTAVSLWGTAHGRLAAASVFQLSDPGVEPIVHYEKYGEFSGLGTPEYHYYIKDREGLARAVGEGIYPNVTGLLKDPAFQKMQFEKKLTGSPWDY